MTESAAIAAVRERYGVPAHLHLRLLLRSDAGAEAWLLHAGEQLVGRIERPSTPLPGRALWTLYDAAGRALRGSEHPRHFDFSKLSQG